MKLPGRAGFSLLEVLLATSVLLGSAVVLAELADIGRRHARSTEELAAAQLICQAKLNEILVGAATLETIEDQPVADQPGWVYSVETEPLSDPSLPVGLALLRVTARQDLPEEQRPRQFTLARWIRDLHPSGGEDNGPLPPRPFFQEPAVGDPIP